LTQETQYPWDGHVEIAIEEAPSREISVFARIPGWAEGTEVRVNGEPLSEGARPGTYAQIKRAWTAGDRVEIDLPMPARLVRAHPRVEALRNQVAVMRGPVVYCLESVDLPEGVNIAEVHMPSDAALTPRHDEHMLGGVTLLEGAARRIVDCEWSGELYKPLADSEGESIPVTLIPYYAWHNRGATEMTVWLPIC